MLTIIWNVIVRELIKNSQFRMHNWTQTNASFLNEIKKKVSYAAREESQFHFV